MKNRDAVILNVSAEAVTVRFVPIVAAKKAISICIFTSPLWEQKAPGT